MDLDDPGSRATVMRRMAYVLESVVILGAIGNAVKDAFSRESVMGGVLYLAISSILAVYLLRRSAGKDAYFGAVTVNAESENFEKEFADKLALVAAMLLILGALARLFR
ncbi:MAG TPA: hypothetical protein PLF26_19300 [Blastocatellia bacterium]|nr:hypothetical protein [Blastocatellia bacterium]